MTSRHSPISKAGNGIAKDFQALANHAEELLKATADITSSKVKSARDQLDASLSEAQGHIESAQEYSIDLANAAVDRSVAFIRERPYQAAAIAGLVGLAVAGVWYSRSRH